MAQNKLSRTNETRDKTERKRAWQRPELLPSPDPQPGYKFHWVRVSTLGTIDPTNISSKLREGWEPAKAEDHPEMKLMVTDTHEKFKDNIVIGGLLLCKAPDELVEERNEYYADQANAQMKAVDNNYLREDDPRMKKFAERNTQVKFGNGS